MAPRMVPYVGLMETQLEMSILVPVWPPSEAEHSWISSSGISEHVSFEGPHAKALPLALGNNSQVLTL